MSKLDDLISEALSASDKDILKETEELGYFSLGLSQFGGKLGWVTLVIMVVQAASFFVGVWCAVNFFNVDNVLAALKWGLPGTVALLTGLSLKLSLAPQMQPDRVIREVRRLELLVASQK